eukprot:4910951-Pyramimonas_sp.AAC.1
MGSAMKRKASQPAIVILTDGAMARAATDARHGWLEHFSDQELGTQVPAQDILSHVQETEIPIFNIQDQAVHLIPTRVDFEQELLNAPLPLLREWARRGRGGSPERLFP